MGFFVALAEMLAAAAAWIEEMEGEEDIFAQPKRIELEYERPAGPRPCRYAACLRIYSQKGVYAGIERWEEKPEYLLFLENEVRSPRRWEINAGSPFARQVEAD